MTPIDVGTAASIAGAIWLVGLLGFVWILRRSLRSGCTHAREIGSSGEPARLEGTVFAVAPPIELPDGSGACVFWCGQDEYARESIRVPFGVECGCGRRFVILPNDPPEATWGFVGPSNAGGRLLNGRTEARRLVVRAGDRIGVRAALELRPAASEHVRAVYRDPPEALEFVGLRAGATAQVAMNGFAAVARWEVLRIGVLIFGGSLASVVAVLALASVLANDKGLQLTAFATSVLVAAGVTFVKGFRRRLGAPPGIRDVDGHAPTLSGIARVHARTIEAGDGGSPCLAWCVVGGDIGSGQGVPFVLERQGEPAVIVDVEDPEGWSRLRCPEARAAATDKNGFRVMALRDGDEVTLWGAFVLRDATPRPHMIHIGPRSLEIVRGTYASRRRAGSLPWRAAAVRAASVLLLGAIALLIAARIL